MKKIISVEELKIIFNKLSYAVGGYYCNDRNEEDGFLNNAFFEMIGYTREEYEKIGVNKIKKLVFSQDVEKVHDFMNKVHKEKKEGKIEYRTIKKNGKILWVSLEISIVKYINEYIFIANFIDITRTKEKTEQLDLIANHIKSSISIMKIVDGLEQLIYANEEFFKLIGVQQSDYYKNPRKYNRRMVREDDWKKIQKKVFVSLVTGETTEVEYMIYPIKGENVLIRRRCVAIKQDKEGEYLLASIATDISNIKGLKHESKVQKQINEFILENSNSVILQWNYIENVFTATKSFDEYCLSSQNPDNILKYKFDEEVILLQDKKIFQTFLSNVTLNKDNLKCDIRLKLTNGNYRKCEVFGLNIIDNNKKIEKTILMINNKIID